MSNLCCPCRNIQQKRAIPSISKSREEEIRKILRANLQKTRQRVGENTILLSRSIQLCRDNTLYKPILCTFFPMVMLVFLLSSFVLTADTTWWWTGLRTIWVRFVSGGSEWRWRGGWVCDWGCKCRSIGYLSTKRHAKYVSRSQMSHYLTVPANRHETPAGRKVCFETGQFIRLHHFCLNDQEENSFLLPNMLPMRN